MRDPDFERGNFAYIDNQNLYMATHNAEEPWDVDMRRFRVYLREKYGVVRAYLFMSAFEYRYQERYLAFQRHGYVLVFREHGENLKGKKKGNVDVDVVFEMMRDLYTSPQMDKAVLVSGDGDYFRTVDHFLNLDRLERVLLPSKKNASSLYKRLPEGKKAVLDTAQMRRKLARAKR